MTPRVFTVLCMVLASTVLAVSAVSPSTAGHQATRKDFIRMRCNTEKAMDTMLSWTGTSYSLEPQKEQRQLFDLFGINVARCWFDEASQSWLFTSRELQYYLDPKTGKPLYKWLNPWTGETNNVVHVANDPVQMPFGNAPAPYILEGDGVQATFASNINLFYPNPLFGNDTLKPYAWYKNYEGSELFKFYTPETEVLNETSTFAPTMHFSWTRISQWLPFMKMDGRPGSMLFTASGSRTSFEELPPWLQDDISKRLPIYKHAPPCMLDVPDSTSWTYFKEHFDAFLNGDQFPISVSESPPCKK